MRCSEADAFIHAYVDGELAGLDHETYEQHLVACDTCSHACRLQARFKAAIRGHLPRRAVPDRLVARVQACLADASPIRRRALWNVYPRLVPAVAAMTALVVVLALARTGRQPRVFEQARGMYQAALPWDVAGPSCRSIADWFRGRVDFAVPAPSAKMGNCQGGRLVNVQDRFGAYIVYEIPNGHRIGMMVFSAGADTLSGARRRLVGDRDVYLGTARGASTAAYRDRDLMYVVTSDLDEDSLTNLVERALFSPQ